MSLLMLFTLAESTTPDFLMLRFLLVVFLVRMWLPKALLLMIFPDPVFLKRFAAPRLVFIFGITYLLKSIRRPNAKKFNAFSAGGARRWIKGTPSPPRLPEGCRSSLSYIA
jgi:hypothetical protein